MFKQSHNSIIGKLIHFIKYHNAFVIGLVFVFLLGASVFAVSPQTIIDKETTRTGVDNSALLATDFSEFDQEIKIESVKEDSNKYYLEYSFNSFAVKDNRWQETEKRAVLEVSKKALQGSDLGIYAAEELSEVAKADMRKLKAVQKNQKEKGLTHIQETTEYSGLAGLVLNSKTKTLPGYKPIREKAEGSQKLK